MFCVVLRKLHSGCFSESLRGQQLPGEGGSPAGARVGAERPTTWALFTGWQGPRSELPASRVAPWPSFHSLTGWEGKGTAEPGLAGHTSQEQGPRGGRGPGKPTSLWLDEEQHSSPWSPAHLRPTCPHGFSLLL